MLPTALLTALLAAVATAVPNVGQVSTSVASKQTCITKYRPAPRTVSPLPTNTRTSAQTVSSTVTTCGGASTTTVTVTPDAITSTVHVNAPSILLPSNIFVTVHAKKSAACSMTTTISAGLSTVFTGTYNGTIATSTASPPGLNRSFDQQRNAIAANLFHLLGQTTVSRTHNKVAVYCLDQMTTYYITTSTLVAEPATETSTAATPTVYITQTNEAWSGPTAPPSITKTITEPQAENGVCTVTSAESTTTQHVKCAPTNLVSSVNGKGIGQTGGDLANTRGLAPGSDPSACCQLCVDDEECAASEDDPDAGNCFLWYTTPSCGLGFRYSDGGQNLNPGKGLLVQTGCGTVQAVDSF